MANIGLVHPSTLPDEVSRGSSYSLTEDVEVVDTASKNDLNFMLSSGNSYRKELRKRQSSIIRARERLGEFFCVPVLCGHNGRVSVSLLWIEKWWIVIHFLQTFAVIWASACTPSTNLVWPFDWCDATSWQVFFNLDYGAYRRWQTSPSGSFANFAWAMVAIIITLMISFVAVKRHTFVKRAVKKRAERFMMGLAGLLFLPTAIAFFRTMDCQGDKLFSDESVECWSGTHSALVGLAAVALVLFHGGYTLMLYLLIEDQIIFDDNANHDIYIRSKEVEQMLGLEKAYEHDHFHVFASFKRSWMYFRVVDNIAKIALAATAVFLRNDNELRGWLLLVIIIAPLLPQTFRVRPYRLGTASWLFVLLTWLNAANTLTYFFKASDVRSVLMVDSNLLNILTFINVLGLGIFVTIIGYTLAIRQQWPVNDTLIENIRSDFSEWINAIYEARLHVRAVRLQPPEIVRMDDLDKIIQQINLYWQLAMVGSRDEDDEEAPLSRVPSLHNITSQTSSQMRMRGKRSYELLGERSTESHTDFRGMASPSSKKSFYKPQADIAVESDPRLLQNTLGDTLEELVQLHNELAPVSMLPCPALEAELPQLQKRLQQRDAELIFMPTPNRAILTKITALNALIWGGRRRRAAKEQRRAARRARQRRRTHASATGSDTSRAVSDEPQELV